MRARAIASARSGAGLDFDVALLHSAHIAAVDGRVEQVRKHLAHIDARARARQGQHDATLLDAVGDPVLDIRSWPWTQWLSAQLARLDGDLEKADQHLERAERYAREAGPLHSVWDARNLRERAEIQLRLGDLDFAARLLKRAEAVHRLALDDESPWFTEMAMTAARIALAAGNIDEAGRSVQVALRLEAREPRSDEFHAGVQRLSADIARAQVLAGTTRELRAKGSTTREADPDRPSRTRDEHSDPSPSSMP